jgi:cell division protein FtsW (lipid II flippase)
MLVLESPRRNRELRLLTGAMLLAGTAIAAVQIAAPRVSTGFVIAAGTAYILLYLLSHLALRIYAPHADPLLLPVVALLSGLSLAMIYRLDLTLAWHQLAWLAVGNVILIILVARFKNYRVLANYKYLLGLAGVVLLFSTIRLGAGFLEPNLWWNLGPFSFQPSEIAKILIVVFFAAYLSEKRELLSVFTRKIGRLNVPDLKHLGPMLMFWLVSVGLLVIQKDIGASLLFFGLFLVMLYVATDRGLYVAIGSLLFIAGAAFTARAFSHVATRIQIWLNPWVDPSGKSYQLVQSLFAFGSGGIWGSGLGRGYPSLIPVVATDFIFSAFGEEIGLVGVIAVIALYLVFVGRGLNIASKTTDEFGKLLAVGLTAVFAIQTFVIIGGVTRLVPLTGITLPFLSYGGSSILANFLLLGLLLIISNQSIEEASEIR